MTFPAFASFTAYSGAPVAGLWTPFTGLNLAGKSCFFLAGASNADQSIGGSGTGWQTIIGGAGAIAYVLMFKPDCTASETLAFSGSAFVGNPGNFRGILGQYTGAKLCAAAANIFSGGTTSDSPNLAIPNTRDADWIAALVSDEAMSSAPTGYGNLTTATNTDRVSVARKQLAAASENPASTAISGTANPSSAALTIALYSQAQGRSGMIL